MSQLKKFADALGVSVSYQAMSFYGPAKYDLLNDMIVMYEANLKLENLFHLYDRVLAHELIHSTGAIHRLNRLIYQENDLKEDFSIYHAREELTAELGAMLLLNQMQHPQAIALDFTPRYRNVLSLKDQQLASKQAIDAVNYIWNVLNAQQKAA